MPKVGGPMASFRSLFVGRVLVGRDFEMPNFVILRGHFEQFDRGFRETAELVSPSALIEMLASPSCSLLSRRFDRRPVDRTKVDRHEHQLHGYWDRLDR